MQTIHGWASRDSGVVENRVAKAKIDHGMDMGNMKLREVPHAVTECSPKVLLEVCPKALLPFSGLGMHRFRTAPYWYGSCAG